MLWRWLPGSGWAMIQRNRAEQGVRDGGVRETPILQGRKRLRDEKCG